MLIATFAMANTTSLAGSIFSRLSSVGWQGPDAIDSGNAHLLMIFIGLVAFCILVVTITVVILAVGLMKAEKKLMGYIAEIKGKAMPLIDKSTGLVTELTPQIKGITEKVNVITGHVGEISAVVKDKVNEFSPTLSAANVTIRTTIDKANETVLDANQKTHAQVNRVNGMITTALDATTKLGETLHHGINQPAREIAGVVSGVKAAIDSLKSKTRGFGAGITRNSEPNTDRPVTRIR